MGEQYISGKPSRTGQSSSTNKYILASLLLAVVIVGGIWFGMSHASKYPTDNTATQPSTLGYAPTTSSSGGVACSQTSPCSGQQSGAGHQPVVGKITAVSSTSITIQPSDGSSPRTFTIGKDIQVLNGANQAAVSYDASNFKVGETVGVAATGSDSNQADVILPNYQSMTSN